MATSVINHYTTASPAGVVMVMRPSKWGSPYELGPDGDRTEILHKYREWLEQQPASFFADVRSELQGHTLLCCCAPLQCHGDFLAAIADEKPWPKLPPRQGSLF
jgi:hypothetical protein